jgi:hypothetical protein
MGRIPSWLTFGSASVAGLAVTLPLVSSSCGRTACIVVSQVDLQQSGGVCPTSDQASRKLVDPGCVGPITSVDGTGELDGQLCCYPVTETTDNNFECFGGVGGFAEFGSSGVGGVGGSGGGFTCAASGDPCDPFNDTCCTLCDSTINACE